MSPTLTKSKTKILFFIIFSMTLFLFACRTAQLLEGTATPEPTNTRVAVRPTFTTAPTETETPVPTDTLEPTETETPEPPTATRRPTRRPPTRPPPTEPPPPPTEPQPTQVPTPQPVFAFAAGSPTCNGNPDASESRVKGTISANGAGAVRQRVQASSGPGGSPISENPSLSDSSGNYTVTFICGGGPCNGDFWVWMVNAQLQQSSPYVKFHFDNNCRVGHVDFTKR